MMPKATWMMAVQVVRASFKVSPNLFDKLGEFYIYGIISLNHELLSLDFLAFLSLKLYAIMCQLFTSLGRLPMNIQALMQQAQAMQKQVEKNVEAAKASLATKEVQGEAGNGLVKVTMTGRHVVKCLAIDPSLMDDEPDMIEDLVAAAINDAVRQADELYEEVMAGATTGMGLPPSMKGLFG